MCDSVAKEGQWIFNLSGDSRDSVGGAALHEIAVSSAREMDMQMIVATLPTSENVCEEGAHPECVIRKLFV